MSGLTIGGVEIRVRSQVDLTYYPEDFYSPFLTSYGSRGANAVSMDVEIRDEEAPPSQEPVLFDTGSSWYMQADSSGYRVSIRKGPNASDLVSAICDADTTKVRLYVGRGARLCESVSPGTRHQVLLSPIGYPLDQLLVMNHLVSRGGVVIHAAAAVAGGKALVFAGASQAGKSTMARLFADAGLKESLLSDDRVILRLGSADASSERGRHEPGVTVWGTPWAGDAREARNASAPLGALFFLRHDEENRAVPIDVGMALRLLMPVASVPWYDAERMATVLDTCGRVVESAPCHELRFRPDQDIVHMLTGGSWRKDRGSS